MLNEIRPRLNAGWDLTPALQAGNLWKAYQEAQVVSAATTHGLRLASTPAVGGVDENASFTGDGLPVGES